MAEDARLQIVLEAKIDKLTQKLSEANTSVARSSKKIQQDLDAANKNWEHMFLGEGPGKAIENIFSRSRLAVFEEGSAKIPLFGSALEALGPAGFTAAAGVAALGAALEEAHKALEWADELDRFAKTVGVSTTYLQEFDYAAIGSSVGVARGREALQGFNEAFGKFSSGLASAKQAKWFDALGFTPEGARNLTTIDQALDQTLQRLAAIQNPSQRAAFAKQLGLDALLPVLAEGQEGLKRFKESMDELRNTGGIVSKTSIEQAAALNDRIEQLQHRIGIDLKEAFIGFGPVLEGFEGLLERITGALARVAQGVGGVLQQMRQMAQQDPGFRQQAYQSSKALDRGFGLSGQIMRFMYGIKEDGSVSAPAKPPAEGGALGAKGNDFTPPKVSTPRTAPHNATDEQVKKAAEELASQTKALADAQAALTTDILAKAEFERQAVAAERDKAVARIDADEKALATAQGLDAATRGRLKAEYDAARTLAQQAASTKTDKITNDAETALAAQQLEDARTIHGYYDTIRSNTAALARTSAERRDAELAILASQHRQELAEIEAERATKLRGATPAQATGINSRYDAIVGASTDAYASKVQKTIHDNQGALAAWREDVLKNAGEVQDALEKAAVKGFDAFNDGVANAIANGQSLGDVMHSVFASMEADLIKYLLKQAEIGALDGGGGSLFSGFTGLLAGTGARSGLDLDALAASLPAFASGGLVTGAGGPKSDNVLARLSPGEFVLSNDMLRSMSNMKAPAPQPPVYAPSYDMRGSLVTEDVMNRISRAEAQAGAATRVSALNSQALQRAQKAQYARASGLTG